VAGIVNGYYCAHIGIGKTRKKNKPAKSKPLKLPIPPLPTLLIDHKKLKIRYRKKNIKPYQYMIVK
jgi:hypothetical protein